MDFNKSALKEEYAHIISNLKILGLTRYEAQAFLALIYLKSASATDIAVTAKIPRPSAYKVLDALSKKQFIKILSGKPKMFKITELNVLEERYSNLVTTLFSKMKMIQDLVSEKGEPQLVYTVSGKTAVLNKIGMLIDETEEEVLLSSPRLAEIKKSLSKKIKNAISRNVKVIIITEHTQRPPPNSEVYYKDGLIATDMVCDRKKALIADSELGACGYSDNPVLAEHLHHFMEIMVSKK